MSEHYYIRTDTNIFEVVDKNEKVYRVLPVCRDSDKVYSKSKVATNVIKSGKTIEELCDEFVVCVKGNPICQFNRSTWNYNEIKYLGTHNDFYGAIWIDKGLKYVAKLNEKGDLELI